MDLVLIRHPAPAVERGVCYGRTDVPLAVDEREAAAAIVARLAALDVPLPQAVVTGEFVTLEFGRDFFGSSLTATINDVGDCNHANDTATTTLSYALCR